MPCYQPLSVQQYISGRDLKTVTIFNSKQPNAELPCGRCVGCLLERAKEWGLRCHHEAQMHEQNCFITLTYDEEHIPQDRSLRPDDFTKFLKRLRKRVGPIRYFMCGEYGNAPGYRPHYHAIIFGYDFPNKRLVNIRTNKNRVYTSPLLSDLWPHGSHEIGSVTYKSANYVARYILKKQQGDQDEIFNRYVIVDPDTGEMHSRELEYTRCSLKPGIGETFFNKYTSDFFPHDYAIMPDGRRTPVPAYYRRLLQRNMPELAETLRLARIEKAKDNPNNTPTRLEAREKCQQAKLKRLKRTI